MISRFIFFKLLGWKITGEFPVNEKKLIVVSAPHTSMFDFVLGWLYYRVHGLSSNFLIKSEMFFFPVGNILRALGSIPVKRGKASLVDQMAEEFAKRDRVILSITPEGTRKKVSKWKRGFYKISEKTGTPIVIGYIDYGRKVMGVFPGTFFRLTGDINADMKRFQNYYKGITPKYPDRFTTE